MGYDDVVAAVAETPGAIDAGADCDSEAAMNEMLSAMVWWLPLTLTPVLACCWPRRGVLGSASGAPPF